ncbi:hypothetical protein [Metabacillus litoralis]|nr:hypothetical protein [Metabacillus litoralis]
MKENLVKIFSDDDMAKGFFDSIYELNKASFILKINEFQDNSDVMGVPFL